MSAGGSGGKMKKEREVREVVGKVCRVQMGVYGVTGLYRT